MNLVHWPADPLTQHQAFGYLRACLARREHNDNKSKPTGKATDLLRLDDRRPVLKTAPNTGGPPYLLPNSAIRNCCRSQLRRGKGAESRGDFIHKLKVVFKELNETTISLELIGESSLLSAENIVGIVAENRELCRIIAASINTARMSRE